MILRQRQREGERDLLCAYHTSQVFFWFSRYVNNATRIRRSRAFRLQSIPLRNEGRGEKCACVCTVYVSDISNFCVHLCTPRGLFLGGFVYSGRLIHLFKFSFVSRNEDLKKKTF